MSLITQKENVSLSNVRKLASNIIVGYWVLAKEDRLVGHLVCRRGSFYNVKGMDYHFFFMNSQ